MLPTVPGCPRVRLATPVDRDEIIAMCMELHGENALFPVEMACVHETVDRALRGDNALIGVVGDAQAEGMIYLQLSRMWYSRSVFIEELFNYVRPKFRASTNSQDLIAFGKAVSDMTEMLLLIGVLSNIRTEAKVRLYRKALGAPAGAYFVHAPAHSAATKAA